MILHISFGDSRVATARRVLSPVSPTRPRRHGHLSRERRLPPFDFAQAGPSNVEGRGGRGCPPAPPARGWLRWQYK